MAAEAETPQPFDPHKGPPFLPPIPLTSPLTLVCGRLEHARRRVQCVGRLQQILDDRRHLPHAAAQRQPDSRTGQSARRRRRRRRRSTSRQHWQRVLRDLVLSAGRSRAPCGRVAHVVGLRGRLVRLTRLVLQCGVQRSDQIIHRVLISAKRVYNECF